MNANDIDKILNDAIYVYVLGIDHHDWMWKKFNEYREAVKKNPDLPAEIDPREINTKKVICFLDRDECQRQAMRYMSMGATCKVEVMRVGEEYGDTGKVEE